MSRIGTTLLFALLIACFGRPAGALRDRNGDGVVKIACVGDSNTDGNYTPTEASWCDLVAAQFPAWELVNRGVIFATAHGDCKICGLGLLDYSLLRDAPDLVIVALGTNDIVSFLMAPEVAAEALIEIRQRALAADVEAVIATIPPWMNGTAEINGRIDFANALLSARIPADRLIDFHDTMTTEDFHSDGVHVNLSGQRKRAAAAQRWLSRS